MASPSATLHTKAQNFLTTHTEIVPRQDLSPVECCAICLDTYMDEPAMRITGISGCMHIIGRDCLISMLNSAPGSVLKCPLCRTIWIDDREQRTAIEIRRNGLEEQSQQFEQRDRFLLARGDLRQAQVTYEETAREISRLRARAADTGPFRFRRLFTQRYELHRRHGVLAPHPERSVARAALSPNSEVEEDVDEESYEAYRRDIENMRMMAANTGPRMRQRNAPFRPSTEANETPAIASNSNSHSAESVAGEDEYEELTQAIDDIRARAASTRYSFPVQRRQAERSENDMLRAPRRQHERNWESNGSERNANEVLDDLSRSQRMVNLPSN